MWIILGFFFIPFLGDAVADIESPGDSVREKAITIRRRKVGRSLILVSDKTTTTKKNADKLDPSADTEEAYYWERFLQGVGGSMSLPQKPRPTAEPIPSPSPSPSLVTMSPTAASPTASVSCVPTAGPCLEDMDDLIAVIAAARHGAVIALCEGASLNPVEPLVVSQSSITLCCESQDCFLGTTGGNLLLQVLGNDFTLSNIRFQDGGGAERGSNLEIKANGTILIEDCIFDGAQGFGTANVFIQTFGDLLVRRSSFTNSLNNAGRGLEVEDAAKVLVQDSDFRGNSLVLPLEQLSSRFGVSRTRHCCLQFQVSIKWRRRSLRFEPWNITETKHTVGDLRGKYSWCWLLLLYTI